MSSALAIASVTAVLKDLLDNGLVDHSLTDAVGPVTVSAVSPDRIASTDVETDARLNLFLYQVTPNTGWRNVGLPSHNGNGDRIANPPLALDLHYMLTAYGVSDFQAEILLGYGMQLLHETPVLPREAIRRALAAPLPVDTGGGLPPAMAALATSELADQVEMIKLTPLALDTEELSRVWSALQARYRPTAAYRASVVLIESRRSTRSSLPVRDRKVYVLPFRQPIIEEVRSQADADDPASERRRIVTGDRLVLMGRNLAGDVTRVLIGGAEFTPDPADVAERVITVEIPASVRGGVQVVQIIHRLMLGDPATEHRGVESNVAAFVLSPTIVPSIPDPLDSEIIDSVTYFSGEVELAFTPEVGRTQRVVMLLNERGAVGESRSYSFIVPPRDPGDPATSPVLRVPFSGVEAGTYLVRAQVDGAESVLIADFAEPPGPTYGLYTDPAITVA